MSRFGEAQRRSMKQKGKGEHGGKREGERKKRRRERRKQMGMPATTMTLSKSTCTSGELPVVTEEKGTLVNRNSAKISVSRDRNVPKAPFQETHSAKPAGEFQTPHEAPEQLSWIKGAQELLPSVLFSRPRGLLK